MKSWFLAPLALLPHIQGAYAAEIVQTQHTRAALVAEHRVVAPGESVQVALSFDLAPGWHTYWRTPGDAGEAATIRWTLPEGVSVGEIQWPTPERFDYAGIAGFGYTGKATLLAEVKVDPSVKAPADVVLKAEAMWLVCATVCIPEEGSFSLPVRIDATRAQPGGAEAAFAAARAVLPVHAPWPVKATRAGETLILTAGPGVSRHALKQVTFFPENGALIVNGAKQDFQIKPDGTLELRTPLLPGGDKPGDVRGVLRLEQANGAAPLGYVFAVPFDETH